MKLALPFAFLLVAAAMGCAASRPAADDRAAIERLARARSDALVARDERALIAILDEGFVYTNASGERLDRAAYLARYLRAPEVRWLAQELDDVDVRVFGDTAILTGRVHDRATFGEHALDARFRTTFVYVRRGDGWRCVAGHTSNDAEPPR